MALPLEGQVALVAGAIPAALATSARVNSDGPRANITPAAAASTASSLMDLVRAMIEYKCTFIYSR